MTDGDFARRARDAAKTVGGIHVEGKRYGMNASRTGDAALDDRLKDLILDVVKTHGKSGRA